MGAAVATQAKSEQPDKTAVKDSLREDRAIQPRAWCATNFTCHNDAECAQQEDCREIARYDPYLIFCGSLFWPHSCWAIRGGETRGEVFQAEG
ncbi:hypothetical protein GX50_05903 [[Emmonsia] crescens]|uniref:Uncharacterized protein n=1 Tax=[Emmonsia] crescens TaxID=73230 RepID=A0A2B7ZDN7_9EURO|nr:hypothetical protein GX50_05903 [Emmonsia crescens]